MKRSWVWLVTITGLSFWFALGYPFGNHNESYSWVTQLNEYSATDVLTKRLDWVSSFRPLTQLIAWVTFKLSGGIWPAQLLNYLFAVAGWLLLYYTTKEKRTFSLVALLVGGVLFSGYIYLFHLHGLCYLLMPLAVALLVYAQQGGWDNKKAITTFIFAVVASLTHPFAMFLYIAATTGLIIERFKQLTKKHQISLVVLALLAATSISTLAIEFAKKLQPQDIDPLMSFRTVELNMIVTAVVFLLCIATAASLEQIKKIRIILILLTTVLSIALFKLHLPLIPLWIALCLVKTVWMKKWSLAFLMAGAAILPVAMGNCGSPTYAVFILIACAAVTPLGWYGMERKLGFINNRSAVGLAVILATLVIVLRLGVHVPVVSKLANPVLAESERTHQMEDVVEWLIASDYKDYYIEFYRPAGAPSVDGSSTDRTHRPPTRYFWLDPYVDGLRGKEGDESKKLLITFGDDPIASATEVYRIDGKFAGDVILYLK